MCSAMVMSDADVPDTVETLDEAFKQLMKDRKERAYVTGDNHEEPIMVKRDNPSLKKYLFVDSMAQIINDIRYKLRKNGQLILSYDASAIGPESPIILNDRTFKNSTSRGARITDTRAGGFASNIFMDEDAIKRDKLSPLVAFTSSLKGGDDLEIRVGDNVLSAYTYAMCKAIANPNNQSYLDIYIDIKREIDSLSLRQKPGIAGDIFEPIFKTSLNPIDTNDESLEENPGSKRKSLKLSGDCYVISIGIDSSCYHYPSRLQLNFHNCVTDAKGFADFIHSQFTGIGKFPQIIHSYLLIDKMASRDSIVNVLNDIIQHSKPNDYFIFNFAGYSIPVREVNGKTNTYFIPADANNLADTADLQKKGIPLAQLKDLMELIPANNQLMITEAGPSADFQREFVKALVESSTDISSISNRNRVIIVPGKYGCDNVLCNGERINQGPLNYYLTSLPSDCNLFSIFQPGSESENVEHIITKKEMECNSFDYTYSRFFYEKKFVGDMKFYLEDSSSSNRGISLPAPALNSIKNRIKEKHALIIGTNKFADNTYWGSLANPVNDARAIADELSSNYGFKARLLVNPTLDSVYQAIQSYSKLDSNDQLLIFFAGHGDFDDSIFDDGFIVMSNSSAKASDPYRKTYLQHSQLSLMINKLRPKQIMVLLDVCYGGTFGGYGANGRRAISNQGEDDYISNMLKYKTRIYISSGGKNMVPDGYKGDHSPFAKIFLKTLKDKGGEQGFLTSTGIYARVQFLPSKPRHGRFGDDEADGDFILIPEDHNVK